MSTHPRLTARKTDLLHLLQTNDPNATIRIILSFSSIHEDHVEIRTLPLFTTVPDVQINTLSILDCKYDPSADPTVSYMDYKHQPEVFQELADTGNLAGFEYVTNLRKHGLIASLNQEYWITLKELRAILMETCVQHFLRIFGRSMLDTVELTHAQNPGFALVGSEFQNADTKGYLILPVWWALPVVEYRKHQNEQQYLAAEDSLCYQFSTLEVATSNQNWVLIQPK